MTKCGILRGELEYKYELYDFDTKEIYPLNCVVMSFTKGNMNTNREFYGRFWYGFETTLLTIDNMHTYLFTKVSYLLLLEYIKIINS